MRLETGETGTSSVPSGASTGTREAAELRDGDPARYGGRGVLRAVAHVNDAIARSLLDMNAADQKRVDETLCSLDGTENKSRLGANAILGVSQAVSRAAAKAKGVPLYAHLSLADACILPTPQFNVLNGGVHADNSVDFQEFMIAPVGATSFRDSLRMGAEIYQALKSALKEKGYGTTVGDEGGFAPNLRANVEAIDLILEAIARAGFTAGADVVIALDPAASEFFEGGAYVFRKSDGSRHSSAEMIHLYGDWIRQFPIWSIEDGLAEDDWDGWRLLTERLGHHVQLVGDDIFVTNPAIIRKAVESKIANASLIKLNQVGTVTETLAAMAESRSAGYATVISHRSGETTDDFIADLAVATSAMQIKSGAPARGERVAKYNRLCAIEEELGSRARFAGAEPFKR